jgi:hypothetical protein
MDYVAWVRPMSIPGLTLFVSTGSLVAKALQEHASHMTKRFARLHVTTLLDDLNRLAAAGCRISRRDGQVEPEVKFRSGFDAG